MIKKVVAVGFKGLEFSYDLGRLNLVVGPMGCGKTSISDTIELTTSGRIPGAGKTNQAIMDAFASDDKMCLGVGVNGEFFERRFIRGKSGKVTQKFRAGNTFVSKEDFITAFAVAGCPLLFNPTQFMGLSDEKKTSEVFRLYPPKGDVFALHEKIDQTTEGINALSSEITKTEGIISKLLIDQAKVELPPGTLAEIQNELDKNEAEIRLCRKNLGRQIQTEADAAAKAKAEKAAAEAAKKEESRSQLGGPVTHTARNSEDFQKPRKNIDEMVEEVEKTISKAPKDYPMVAPDPAPKYGTKEHARAMVTETDRTDTIAEIQGIINTMDEAGCTACAAKMVAKQALIKLNSHVLGSTPI
ncbi:MAG: hypothetical protein BBJ57_07300 [Desulfobacterales bacterium PC51MH44]|nr:MAG: hypothetical protein BBJ57_07300 [Desulfobacterales bacterium PC51MH44]